MRPQGAATTEDSAAHRAQTHMPLPSPRSPFSPPDSIQMPCIDGGPSPPQPRSSQRRRQAPSWSHTRRKDVPPEACSMDSPEEPQGPGPYLRAQEGIAPAAAPEQARGGHRLEEGHRPEEGHVAICSWELPIGERPQHTSVLPSTHLSSPAHICPPPQHAVHPTASNSAPHATPHATPGLALAPAWPEVPSPAGRGPAD